MLWLSLQMALLGPELSWLGPQMALLGSQLASLGPQMALLGPELVWLGPELAWLGPELAWLGPQMALLGPELAWLGPQMALLSPGLAWLGPQMALLGPQLSLAECRCSTSSCSGSNPPYQQLWFHKFPSARSHSCQISLKVRAGSARGWCPHSFPAHRTSRCIHCQHSGRWRTQ